FPGDAPGSPTGIIRSFVSVSPNKNYAESAQKFGRAAGAGFGAVANSERGPRRPDDSRSSPGHFQGGEHGRWACRGPHLHGHGYKVEPEGQRLGPSGGSQSSHGIV